MFPILYYFGVQDNRSCGWSSALWKYFASFWSFDVWAFGGYPLHWPGHLLSKHRGQLYFNQCGTICICEKFEVQCSDWLSKRAPRFIEVPWKCFFNKVAWILKSLLKEFDWRWAVTICLFEAKEAKAWPPMDHITCGTMIHALGLGRDASLTKRALKIFESMATKRLEPHITTYNEILTACERGVSWYEFLEVL